jgi:hypothetical protein
MQRPAPQHPWHPAEPTPGSFRSVTGEEADLFNVEHYPLFATCRHCGAQISATEFLRAFRHED